MANIVNPDNTAPEEPSDLDLHYFFRPSCLNISFSTGKFWIIFLSSADFFQNQLFQKPSECQQFGSRSGPTFCWA